MFVLLHGNVSEEPIHQSISGVSADQDLLRDATVKQAYNDMLSNFGTAKEQFQSLVTLELTKA